MRYFFMFLGAITLCALAGSALAVPTGAQIRYEGKGAGEVVFDGTVHAAQGLLCSDCHEARFTTTALFEMKKSTSAITMRKIELGLFCGNCHDVSATDYLSCSKCHHK